MSANTTRVKREAVLSTAPHNPQFPPVLPPFPPCFRLSGFAPGFAFVFTRPLLSSQHVRTFPRFILACPGVRPVPRSAGRLYQLVAGQGARVETHAHHRP